jgi:hypothetical protein
MKCTGLWGNMTDFQEVLARLILEMTSGKHDDEEGERLKTMALSTLGVLSLETLISSTVQEVL